VWREHVHSQGEGPTRSCRPDVCAGAHRNIHHLLACFSIDCVCQPAVHYRLDPTLHLYP